MLLFCIFPVEFDYEHCSYCYMLLFSYRLLKYWKMDIVKNLVFANFNIIVSYIFNRKKIIWNCILRLNEMGICAILFPFRRLYKLCNLSVCFIFFFSIRGLRKNISDYKSTWTLESESFNIGNLFGVYDQEIIF